MASYLEQLQAADPQGYQKLLGLMSYSANENYGGKPQDWQAQIFTKINANAPKTIDLSNPETYQSQGLTKVPVGQDSEGNDIYGWEKSLGVINGLPVSAQYDNTGTLTGYQSDTRQRNFLSGNQSVSGKWDAQGNPTPNQYSSSGGGFLGNVLGGVGSNLSDFLSSDLGKLGLLAGGAYAGGLFDPTTIGSQAIGEGSALATGAGAGGTNLFADMAIPGNAAELAGYGTGAGVGAAATGAGAGLLGGSAEKAALYGDAGYGAGMTGAETAAYDTGLATGAAGAGGAAAAGTGIGAGMAGLTAEQLGTLGLIQGGLGLAGGLLGGSSAADASSQAAQNYAKYAQQGASMAGFRPVGITNTFGTSKFTVDPATGQLTSASYSLSPQLQAYQDAIMGANRQSLSDAQALQSLGRGYVNQSPQDVAAQALKEQYDLLAPSREQAWANLANQDYNRGTTGLKVAQGGGLQAASPYASALANAQAMQDLQLAANARQLGQQNVTFGQGLLSGAYQPFTAGLTAAQNVETLGQQPFGLSSNLANLSSTAGARAGDILTGGMAKSILSQQAANSYNPWSTALQGAASNPLTGLGLMKLFG